MRTIAGRALSAAVFLSAMLTTASAFAHAHLQQQIPAADSTVSVSPQALTLTFSEGVELSFSGVTLNGPE